MGQIIEPLAKNDFNITKLIIADSNSSPITKPYLLKNGENIFKCIAVYTDGTSEEYSPYWTCPIILNSRPPKLDVWGVLGNSKKKEVTIHAAPNHQRYTELTCWIFPPKKQTPTGNAKIPHDNTGFDYSKVT